MQQDEEACVQNIKKIIISVFLFDINQTKGIKYRIS